MRLDHLVISCETLEEGAALVEETLGVAPVAGGRHAYMGTHNRLLSLGPEAYLEVIAIDPGARAPDHARWFGLDGFSGPPRLTNWVVRCDDLAQAAARAPRGVGRITALSRGDFRWAITIPQGGILPFDGIYPGLIQWHGDTHPAAHLPDAGLRMERLSLRYPRADMLRSALPRLDDDDSRIVVETAEAPAIGCTIKTPGGPVQPVWAR